MVVWVDNIEPHVPKRKSLFSEHQNYTAWPDFPPGTFWKDENVKKFPIFEKWKSEGVRRSWILVDTHEKK